MKKHEDRKAGSAPGERKRKPEAREQPGPGRSRKIQTGKGRNIRRRGWGETSGGKGKAAVTQDRRGNKKRKEKNIMKRKFKRIASLVLAAVMVFAMAVPGMTASAASATDDTKSITIEEAPNGHTYNAYQIFKGNVDATGSILSNVDWGDDINGTGKTALAEALGCTEDLNAVIEALKSKTPEQLQEVFMAVWDANGFEKESPTKSASTPAYNAETPSAVSNCKIGDLPQGYYLIIDEPQPSLKDVAGVVYSRMIVQLNADTTVKTKTAVPTAEKKVLDKNDSTGTESGWGDSADYDIGDDVSFQFTGTIAQNYSYYEKYYYAFHDTLGPGLTFNPSSVEVTIDTQKIDPTYYHVITTTEEGLPEGESFMVVFNDLKKDEIKDTEGNNVTVDNGSTIIVTYNAKLEGDNVVIGDPGNPNEMYLEYSNNPQGDDKGKTTVDKVVVFTFDVDVEKVDEGRKPLAGAEFTLEKWDQSLNKGAGAWKTITKMTEITSGTQFTFKGVDDGIYRLKESKTPDGYNTINPDTIYIEVVAEHGEAGITSLTATAYKKFDESTKVLSEKIEGDKPVVNFESNSNEIPAEDTAGAGKIGKYGWVSTEIMNNKGTTLPETGGIGTTIFYVVGSVLVLGAVILLVTKRRMKSE